MEGLRRLVLTGLLLAAALVPSASWSPAVSQTLNERLNQKVQSGKGKDRLAIEARELVYDNDKNTVSAVGDVEMNYQGRTLQADRVIYDRNTKRVFAKGNARLQESDGTVATGDEFDLTDDFKDGFINSLRIQTPDNTRFSAPRAERTEGESTVFERGTYTACEPCKDNPERPPLWQVKAARIIHNNSERTIYYENASLEFWGFPVISVPYFYAPDATVKRKTGFLAPHYYASTALGTGVGVPFFWAIAPNYDLTLTPTVLSRQGFLGYAEWRHRLETGFYNIRVAGINQRDPSAFLPPPLGARDKNFRGSFESKGQFWINERWRWGWDISTPSDKWFYQNYRIRSNTLSTTYFRESTSTIYLLGKGDRSLFDLRSFYFRGLSSADWQKQQPVVFPVLDYDKRFTPPSWLGGEFGLGFNFINLTRDAAQFQELPRQTTSLFFFPGVGGTTIGAYETCSIFNRERCLVRATGGSYTRATLTGSWRRNFIDPLGQVWTPFASFQTDTIWPQIDLSRYQNAFVTNFMDHSSDFVGRMMPTIGLEYRFPFVADSTNWGSHVFEPIVQVVARPNEARIGSLPNEDSQSLVFDDTNLFQPNKFSGYDRTEGGVRANIAGQYTFTTANGAYANLLFGQSYQIFGRNSYARPDLANTGLHSGLESRRSDYVGRIQYVPSSNLQFFARGRFDERNFSLQRFETGTTAIWGPVTSSLTYARYAAAPLLGSDKRKEGLLASSTWSLTPNWSVNGSVLFDLDRHLSDRQTWAALYPNTPRKFNNPFEVASMSLGFGYRDECTTFNILYTTTARDAAAGTKEADRTVLVRLELRTLGQANFSQNIGGRSTQDGISQ